MEFIIHPLTVALVILIVVIILSAIFFRIPNMSRNGGEWSKFNIMRAVLITGVIMAGIIYTFWRKS